MSRSRVLIPGLSEDWQNLGVAVLLHMLFPLAPLAFELVNTGAIGQEALALAAAMYAVGIGISSRNQMQFAAAYVASFFLSAAYGAAVGGVTPLPLGPRLPGITIAAIFVFHLFERYNRHVGEQQPFFEFMHERERSQAI